MEPHVQQIDPVIASYLDPRFRFVVTQIPERVRSREDALGNGLNCIALAHLVIRDLFGFTPPSGYQATELSSDDTHFETVSGIYAMSSGDLLWFGTNNPVVPLADFVPRFGKGQLLNFDEFPINHVGIYTGAQDERGNSLILHASPLDGTNAIWPIYRFAEHARYGTLYKIMRLRAAFKRL